MESKKKQDDKLKDQQSDKDTIKLRNLKRNLILLFGIFILILSFNWGRDFAKKNQQVVFTVNNEIKVSMKNPKPADYNLVNTPAGVRYIITDQGEMTYVFMDGTYYYTMVDLINDSYNGEQRMINNYEYMRYEDDEGFIYYLVKLFNGQRFAYIYGQNDEFLVSVLENTSYLPMN